MKTEIKIILEEGSSNKAQGNCFEDLIRNLLSTHQYKIKQNIRFTGMELDLLAEHRQRKDEILYVECKAKEKVSSIELRTFFANVFHHKADFGYFFRTNELEYDAGGLLVEYRNDERYKNLSFFEPEDIIEMLLNSKMIFEPLQSLKPYTISKKVLVVTYMGDFLIYLINESNLLPTKFIVINAINNEAEVTKNVIDLISSKVSEINKLEQIFITKGYSEPRHNLIESENLIETISEVQESENWYDYLPASSKNKHFVGRDTIRTQILEYFKEIHTNKSHKRIFYLNGKSGWGKSSLLLEIKGRCRNKHYKNKFFTVAIDTRSALSDNFVALSFNKIINSAFEQGFISQNFFNQTIEFTSTTDLLTSDSINEYLKVLKSENKYLVLIFDQFEDVFRKKDLFKSFYKFLSDVSDKKPNIIVGFSWKSEFFIPNDDPAYFYWQQAKEQSREFIIKEFGEKEIDGIIKQLEQSIGKLDREIKNRIKESSQGLPWLTKKLCIHIYEQIQQGLKKDKLIESNLNIKDLFEKDKERIEPDELKGLKLIAQKAYDGEFFEISEVGESIDSKVVDSLLHKRLIIKSGINYNIYWDIFRDYLVTNIIPPIGESFLLRQGVNLCLEVFLLFDKNEKVTIESLHKRHPKKIGKTTLENILIELRNLGLVQKNDEYYSISKGNVAITNDGFILFITQKFQNYTPYLNLKRRNLVFITKDDIVNVLKETFKQEYQDKTWETYALYLISWFLLSEIDIKTKIVEPRKGRGRSRISISTNNALPRMTFNEILKSVDKIPTGIESKAAADLILLGIIDDEKVLTPIGEELKKLNILERAALLRKLAKVIPKMEKIDKILQIHPKITAKQLIEMVGVDFFGGKAKSSKILYASSVMSWLKSK
ncbi:restriction endonuclease [Flavobacterium album]|uniref:restriction endonuclease n=1 Tax=Flavobacterium album TaxID=2175091 RepID=UPI0015E7F1BC|nr:restriction endonuclease [Flavobacterium album]